ncbi:TetR/AcrR family transcriptional regulator [Spirillospora sp. NPDC046719]
MARASDSTGTEAPRARRADARRNAEAILDAAVACLARDPDASVVDIAASAGVGRVTLYGHFKTRGELIDAALVRTVRHADEVLDATDTAGDPVEAFTRLVAASWQIVDQFGNILLAAQRELPAERIRGVHDRVLRRIRSVIQRGRSTGAFRTDLPMRWMVTTVFSLVHAGAEDAAAGRVKADQVAGLITTTLLAAFTAPGAAVPAPHD